MINKIFDGQSIAVTGAAGGIGRAIAEMFVAEGANVYISDRERPDETAQAIGAKAYSCDVSREDDIQAFIKQAETDHGELDVFISNAGVGFSDYPAGHAAGANNHAWQTSWQVNVMSNVYAARQLLPNWQNRQPGHPIRGRFVIVASAAGLLTQIGSASYSTTKHAALGYAEAMAIAHWDEGIRVHAICPQYVKTNMTKGMKFAESQGPMLEPADVAQALKRSIQKDEFLVLSHPDVSDYFKAKAMDYQRYIETMNKLKTQIPADHLPLKS